MTDQLLRGDRIAVLVESEFIPEEIAAYKEHFSKLGASVDFVSRLWGQPKMSFISALDPLTYTPGQQPDVLTVDIDVESVRLSDYAAIIIAANYTSVRLRQFDKAKDGSISPDLVRTAPAVRLFADAMRDPTLVKGALCHGLWILTPTPWLLAGREVMCHEVVLADVLNAGGRYRAGEQVVIDRDLVTGHAKDDVHEFIDCIARQIVAFRRQRSAAAPDSGSAAQHAAAAPSKRILVVLSEWGYWSEELIGPVEILDAAGYHIDFVTPTGKRPNAIAVSMDPDYVDPPLGRPVTTVEMAAKGRAWDDPDTEQGRRLEGPMSLAALMPEAPYFSAPQQIRAQEIYYRERAAAQAALTRRYDALLIVGGSGPIVDLANNQRLHDVILAFRAEDKPIAAECYCVACLAFARELDTRRSIIWGKHVTGHCKEYDYKDGTGFMKRRGEFLDFDMGPPPYPLEYILRDATGPDGEYHGNVGKDLSVIVDHPFITGRSTPDARLTGDMLVASLERGVRRFGW